jgi:hypothetical protein
VTFFALNEGTDRADHLVMDFWIVLSSHSPKHPGGYSRDTRWPQFLTVRNGQSGLRQRRWDHRSEPPGVTMGTTETTMARSGSKLNSPRATFGAHGEWRNSPAGTVRPADPGIVHAENKCPSPGALNPRRGCISRGAALGLIFMSGLQLKASGTRRQRSPQTIPWVVVEQAAAAVAVLDPAVTTSAAGRCPHCHQPITLVTRIAAPPDTGTGQELEAAGLADPGAAHSARK